MWPHNWTKVFLKLQLTFIFYLLLNILDVTCPKILIFNFCVKSCKFQCACKKISATLLLRVSHFLPTTQCIFFQSCVDWFVSFKTEMCFAILIKSTPIYLERDAFYGCAQRNCMYWRSDKIEMIFSSQRFLQKRTNEFNFTTMRLVFVCFLENIEDIKKAFRN